MNKLKKFINYLVGFFPARLPSGMPEFEKFHQMIIQTYGFSDFPSYKHAVASMIQHLGPTTSMKAPYYFAVSLKKAMANQTAFEVIQQIKEAEKKALEEKANEATPQLEAHASEPIPNETI